jgi:hypothetical protein
MKGLVTAVALAAALAGCASAPPPPGLGRLSSNGGLLGAWTSELNKCHSGVRSDTSGTIVTTWFEHAWGRHSSDGYELNVGSISGNLVLVSVERREPFRQIELQADRCARFDVRSQLQPDGSVSVDVDLDCNTGDGGRVVASAHAPSCR